MLRHETMWLPVSQGMSLVPAVTELMLAELLYLQYDNPTRPIYMYINSTGVAVSGAGGVGQALSLRQEAVNRRLWGGRLLAAASSACVTTRLVVALLPFDRDHQKQRSGAWFVESRARLPPCLACCACRRRGLASWGTRRRRLPSMTQCASSSPMSAPFAWAALGARRPCCWRLARR